MVINMHEQFSLNSAAVYIIGIPYRADKLYDYYLPIEIRANVKRGTVVTVPFGRSNRKSYAVVYALKLCDNTDLLKPVDSVENNFMLNEDNLSLCDYMKE